MKIDWKKTWRNIKRGFVFWLPINNPPGWVLKAYDRWERRLPTHPYDMTKHFVGENHIYRVKHGSRLQGEAQIIGWWKKKRIK